MPREIEVFWTTTSGSGKVSVFNFDPADSVASQRAALDAMLAGFLGALHNSTFYLVSPAGREWNDATGELVGAWTDTTPYDGFGTVTGEPVAEASQVLIQWQTGDIADGRFVRGRQFIPGCSNVNLEDGELETTIRAALQGNAQGLITAAVGFGIWHRPKYVPADPPGSGPSVLERPGSFHAATSASIWSEFAVQRKRRN
jgi:hypothetical protein